MCTQLKSAGYESFFAFHPSAGRGIAIGAVCGGGKGRGRRRQIMLNIPTSSMQILLTLHIMLDFSDLKRIMMDFWLKIKILVQNQPKQVKKSNENTKLKKVIFSTFSDYPRLRGQNRALAMVLLLVVKFFAQCTIQWNGRTVMYKNIYMLFIMSRLC